MRKRSRPKPSRLHSHPKKPPRQPRSYTPLSDALNQPLTFADTELAEGIQQHSLAGLLAAAISRQRRCDGEPLSNLLCALLVWPLLKVKSLHCFCAELCQILAGQVSVLYDFLGREDINWRGLASELARRVYQANDLGPRSQRAFVVDDTIAGVAADAIARQRGDDPLGSHFPDGVGAGVRNEKVPISVHRHTSGVH